MVAVPVRPGGAYTDLTWGIFYTRHGWAGLAVVLLYYLEPRRIGRYDLWIDAAVLASLLLFLFYLKITFGAVALGFLAANAVTSGYKFRLAITSLAAAQQPTIRTKSKTFFPYLPLLPAGKDASKGDYQIRILGVAGAQPKVYSKHRYMPSEEGKDLVFWPVDEEAIMIDASR